MFITIEDVVGARGETRSAERTWCRLPLNDRMRRGHARQGWMHLAQFERLKGSVRSDTHAWAPATSSVVEAAT